MHRCRSAFIWKKVLVKPNCSICFWINMVDFHLGRMRVSRLEVMEALCACSVTRCCHGNHIHILLRLTYFAMECKLWLSCTIMISLKTQDQEFSCAVLDVAYYSLISCLLVQKRGIKAHIIGSKQEKLRKKLQEQQVSYWIASPSLPLRIYSTNGKVCVGVQ